MKVRIDAVLSDLVLFLIIIIVTKFEASNFFYEAGALVYFIHSLKLVHDVELSYL